MIESDEPAHPEENLVIHPLAGSVPAAQWTLIASSKKVVKSWTQLCRSTPENAKRCWDILSSDPHQRIPRRCYDLKHKAYEGARCYEVGAGDRVYFKIRESKKQVIIYYAGPHPKSVPYPPSD